MKAILAASAIALTISALTGCAGGTSPLQSQSPPQAAGIAAPAAPAVKAASAFNPFRDESDAPAAYREIITNPTIAEVMQQGPLPEMSLGRPDAPVTIIKYASLTCPYCRKFQLETFPELKREYIDTGKVRFILREFPIGFQSGAATIALRCAPPAQYFTLYEKFLRNHSSWVSQQVRRDPIFKIVRSSGLTRQAFDACYEDKALIANLNTIKDRGRTLGIIGTPNFFINGKLKKRVLTMRDIHKLVAEALAKPVVSAQNR